MEGQPITCELEASPFPFLLPLYCTQFVTTPREHRALDPIPHLSLTQQVQEGPAAGLSTSLSLVCRRVGLACSAVTTCTPTALL